MTSIPKIILGSQSPRRKELFETCGFSVEILSQSIDETFNKTLTPIEGVMDIAKRKAEVLVSKLPKGHILVTADTIVLQDGKILGKPKNEDEAKAFFKAYSDSFHEVVTGVCIYQNENFYCFYEQTKVYFYPIDSLGMDQYIATLSWKDKAGGYGIQDSFGKKYIHKIEGCYYNVMGFPMARFNQELKKWRQ
ncbi:MAG: Maf family protein [Flavobacteriales bacterium]|nr:Maf family protein [Flavobacteriales bacterium]